MKFSKLVTTTALAVTALGGLAYAQSMPEGRVYTFHSKAQGDCPALDWHIVATEGGRLEGMFSWNNMKSMAHATGTANMQSKTFHMTAKEVGGQGRTAEIMGKVRPEDGYLVASVKGPGIKCHDITVPWFTPPPPTGG